MLLMRLVCHTQQKERTGYFPGPLLLVADFVKGDRHRFPLDRAVETEPIPKHALAFLRVRGRILNHKVSVTANSLSLSESR